MHNMNNTILPKLNNFVSDEFTATAIRKNGYVCIQCTISPLWYDTDLPIEDKNSYTLPDGTNIEQWGTLLTVKGHRADFLNEEDIRDMEECDKHE